MELGGSDPVIALEDAPLEVAVDNALLGRIPCCPEPASGPKGSTLWGRAVGPHSWRDSSQRDLHAHLSP
jgi:hypothetical protein